MWALAVAETKWILSKKFVQKHEVEASTHHFAIFGTFERSLRKVEQQQHESVQHRGTTLMLQLVAEQDLAARLTSRTLSKKNKKTGFQNFFHFSNSSLPTFYDAIVQ